MSVERFNNKMGNWKKVRLLIFITVIGVILGLVVYLVSRDKNPPDLLRNTSYWYQFCGKQNLDQKKQCWEDAVDKTINTYGIDPAFDLVDYFYKNDPVFESDCHSYIHLVGEKAYQLYSQNRSLRLSSKSSSCGYGFYHGFMETLLLSGENIKKAGLFCEWAEKQIGGRNDVKGACFHGIGHGISENHDKKSWGNENELVDGPLKICKSVGEDEYMVQRCASGVFNVLAIKYKSNALPLKTQDPLAFCKGLSAPFFKKPCFEEMNTLLIFLSRNDLILASKYLEEIEDQYALSAIRSLAGVIGMGLKDTAFSVQIRSCKKLTERFQMSCIIGLVGGLIEGQTPGSDEDRALSFCNHALLNTWEKDSCHEEALRLLSLYLPSEKYMFVCSNLEERYQSFCRT